METLGLTLKEKLAEKYPGETDDFYQNLVARVITDELNFKMDQGALNTAALYILNQGYAGWLEAISRLEIRKSKAS